MRCALRTALTASVLMIATTAALGQGANQPERQPVKPPKAQKAEDPNTLVNILGMVVMAGAVLGASVIPSRRGHQD